MKGRFEVCSVYIFSSSFNERLCSLTVRIIVRLVIWRQADCPKRSPCQTYVSCGSRNATIGWFSYAALTELSLWRRSLRAVFPSLIDTPFPSGIERRRKPRSLISSTFFHYTLLRRSGDHVDKLTFPIDLEHNVSIDLAYLCDNVSPPAGMR